MLVNDSEKIKILDFVACCEDFSNGKFLLVDSKINNILKKIAECNSLYNLFQEVLTNYNFEKEFSHAQIKFIGKPAKFEMPKEPYKILPLVFCLLIKIQDKSLDFSSFLKTYFSGENDEILEFSRQVIVPFKNIISAIFEVPVDNQIEEINVTNSPQSILNLPKKEVLEDKKIKEEENMEKEFEVSSSEEEFEEIDLSSYFSELEKLINDIMTEIDYMPRLKKDIKEDAYLILDAMLSACELQDLKILNGLIVGFEYIAPSIKNIKFLYKELKKVMLDMYENLV